MTIKSSGSLSLSEIQAEFGGSNPIGLSEYYAGNGRVSNPAPTSPYQIGGPVPTSGRISIGMFYGLSQGGPTSGNNYSVISGVIQQNGVTSVGAGVVFNYDGTVSEARQGAIYATNSGAGGWYNPTTAAIGASYYIKFVRTFGPSVPGNADFDANGLWKAIGITGQRMAISFDTNQQFDQITTVTASISTSASNAGIVATHTIDLEIYREY